jgi:hypothetical protein
MKNKKVFFALMGAVLFAALMILSTVPAGGQGATAGIQANPDGTAQKIQPEPVMNTNVTWSMFNSSMAPNEYLNSTGGLQHFHAGPSVFNANYISVDPADIVSPGHLQNDKLGTHPTWNNLSQWYVGSSVTNVSVSDQYTIVGSQKEIQLKAVVSGKMSAIGPFICLTIPMQNYSSQNINYDYITAIISFSAPANSGAVGYLALGNETSSTRIGTSIGHITDHGTYFMSENLAQLEKKTKLAFNTTVGKGNSNQVDVIPRISIPTNAENGIYTLTLNALALTSYPIYLGQNATGSYISYATGNVQLAKFKPTVPMSVIDNGYTESLSQTLQNITTSQSSINSGSYIEQVTYQGSFQLPTAPDLSYSNSNITMPVSINGNQFIVANLNGVSFTSTLNTKKNGTMLLGPVNPNNANSMVLEVQYTANQWNSISAPPSFFSIAGIEYYWYIFLGILAGTLGLAGAKAGYSAKDEGLRGRR